MKNIKHWLVKLYQHSQQTSLSLMVSSGGSGGNGCLKRLIAEGYSKDKVRLPHRDGFIELLADPYDAELTTYRADLVDSIVCTPVYENEADAKNPSRTEMLEYIKTAIGEGYHPEHVAAVLDLSVIDGLNDGDLNREFGKCWQWYNMGGGMHETFEQKVCFEEVKQANLNALKNVDPQKEKAAADTDEAQSRYDYNSFKSASKPLVKWLNENANPHATVIVEVDGATLYSAESHAPVREFLKD